MSKKKGKKLGFPWEQAPFSGPESRPPDGAEKESGGASSDPPKPDAGSSKEGKTDSPKRQTRQAFPGEITREYSPEESFVKGTARSEISMDEAEALEDTREVAVPEAVRLPRKGSAQAFDSGRDSLTLRRSTRWRRMWNQDPLVLWFRALPAPRKLLLIRANWVVSTCLAIVGLFLVCRLLMFPTFMEAMRPQFAPKPTTYSRLLPRAGDLFDLVEDRSYGRDDFTMGRECLWLARDPLIEVEIAEGGLVLEHEGRSIASLEVEENWDGLLRVYFHAGILVTDEPLYIRIPVVDGGMWMVREQDGVKVLAEGGPVASQYVVGPVFFSD